MLFTIHYRFLRLIGVRISKTPKGDPMTRFVSLTFALALLASPTFAQTTMALPPQLGQMPAQMAKPLDDAGAAKMSKKKMVLVDDKTTNATLNANMGSRVGCLITEHWIQGLDKTAKSLGQKSTRTQTFSVSVFRYNMCTDEILFSGWGESAPTTFVWGGDTPVLGGNVEVKDSLRRISQMFYVNFTFGFVLDISDWKNKGGHTIPSYRYDWSSEGNSQLAYFWGSIGWGPEVIYAPGQSMIGGQKMMRNDANGDQYWYSASVDFWNDSFTQKLILFPTRW